MREVFFLPFPCIFQNPFSEVVEHLVNKNSYKSDSSIVLFKIYERDMFAPPFPGRKTCCRWSGPCQAFGNRRLCGNIICFLHFEHLHINLFLFITPWWPCYLCLCCRQSSSSCSQRQMSSIHSSPDRHCDWYNEDQENIPFH